MNLNKENMRKIRELILFTIVVLIALWKYTLVIDILKFLFQIILPFLVGGAIAFVLNVPMNFIEEKLFRNRRAKESKLAQKISRPVSLAITIFLLIGIVVLVMFVVVPELAKTFLSLGMTVKEFVPSAQEHLEEMFAENSDVRAWIDGLNIDVGKLMDSAVSFFKDGAGNVLGSTFSAIGSIVSGVTTFVIAFVFSCYVLLQKEKLRVQVQKVMYAFLPKEKVEWCLEVLSLAAKTFSNFLTGQCVEAIILGTMFFVTMSVLSMPYALLVGILIAFTALIPIFGAFIGCVVGAFLILMVNPFQAFIFVIMFFVLQQIEGNLIYPKVVGSSVGLPSIWVLAAVTVGGSLMGVLGMLVFIPIVSVVYNLFRASVYKRLNRKNITVPEPPV